jgi:hypothetical protein
MRLTCKDEAFLVYFLVRGSHVNRLVRYID